MSTASEIADRFGNDGQQFDDGHGRSIATVCHAAASHRWVRDGHGTIYVFSDGSMIGVADEAWEEVLATVDGDAWEGDGGDIIWATLDDEGWPAGWGYRS